MRRFALLAALALAGCSKPEDPPSAPTAAPPLVEAELKVLEE